MVSIVLNSLNEVPVPFDSLGPCQFPTLGFVVDRFWQMKCHVPEPFYAIKARLDKNENFAELKWDRVKIFDRATCVILYELCMENPIAIITKIDAKDTKKLYVTFQ